MADRVEKEGQEGHSKKQAGIRRGKRKLGVALRVRDGKLVYTREAERLRNYFAPEIASEILVLRTIDGRAIQIRFRS